MSGDADEDSNIYCYRSAGERDAKVSARKAKASASEKKANEKKEKKEQEKSEKKDRKEEMKTKNERTTKDAYQARLKKAQVKNIVPAPEGKDCIDAGLTNLNQYECDKLATESGG